jgi:hypothetical protein
MPGREDYREMIGPLDMAGEGNDPTPLADLRISFDGLENIELPHRDSSLSRYSSTSSLDVRDLVLTGTSIRADDEETACCDTCLGACLRECIGRCVKAPVRKRNFRRENQQVSAEPVTIKTLLQGNKRQIFDSLVQAVILDKYAAVTSIIKKLEKNGEDLLDDQYRETESTASLLHVALLYQRTEICEMLIDKFPGLLKVMYRSKFYRMQTCFHIAAANGDIAAPNGGTHKIMNYMLDHFVTDPTDNIKKEDLLNTIANGSYFIEERPEAAMCLSAALWAQKEGMITTLVEAGADLGLRGIDGNTLLHYIVYLSTKGLSLEMAQAFIQEIYMVCNKWWIGQENDIESNGDREGLDEQMRFDGFCHLHRIRNDSGFIPLTLAVRLRSPLMPFLLSFEPLYKLPQVKLGAVSWAMYDVTDIVSYKPKPDQSSPRNYDGYSVLHILAHTTNVLSESENATVKTDIIELEPINSTIKMKWSLYRWIYILWCLTHFAYMVSLTCVSLDLHMNQPSDGRTLSSSNQTTDAPIGSTEHVVINRYNKGLVGLFLIIPIFYIISELIDCVVSWPCYGVLSTTKIGPKKRNTCLRKTYVKNNSTFVGNAPYRLLAFCFSVFMFTWYGLYMHENTNSEIPLSLALIVGWIFMLHFTRACPHVCRFSIMIQKMFFRDFLYFLTVYMFILVAFASALHHILPPGPSFGSTVMDLLNIVTNAVETKGDVKPTHENYAAALKSMYAILSVILLLNMLIAMMNTSYESVKSTNVNLWRYQQLSIFLMLERRFFWFKWLCLKSQADVKMHCQGGRQNDRMFLEVTEENITVKRLGVITLSH